MARALGLEVVAEGIEREAQRAAIAREGCASWQGFLGARPMTATEFAVLDRLNNATQVKTKIDDNRNHARLTLRAATFSKEALRSCNMRGIRSCFEVQLPRVPRWR